MLYLTSSEVSADKKEASILQNTYISGMWETYFFYFPDALKFGKYEYRNRTHRHNTWDNYFDP